MPVSVHLKENSSPVFTDWFQYINTFSCLFPRVIRLHLGLQSCWVGSGYKAIIGSAVESVVSRFVTGGSSGHNPVWSLGGWTAPSSYV